MNEGVALRIRSILVAYQSRSARAARSGDQREDGRFDGENEWVTADSPQDCKHIASRSQGQRVWRTTWSAHGWLRVHGERVMVTSKVVLAIVRYLMRCARERG